MSKSHGGCAGPKKTTEYNIWRTMKARCANVNSNSYKDYGGRGVTVCARWANSFEAFLADMGRKPPGCSIERKDLNGNYEPGNCIWADAFTQAQNRRNTRWVTINGETKCVTEWGRVYGIKQTTIVSRFNYGWPEDLAITTPVNPALQFDASLKLKPFPGSKRIWLTAFGATKVVDEWAVITGISNKTIHRRIRDGMAPEKILCLAPEPRRFKSNFNPSWLEQFKAEGRAA